MFQNLRVNSTLYLLHRGANPSLECGQVVNVSPIKTIYKTVPNMPYPQPVQVIDFVVNINGQNVNLQEIPANANIADDIKTGMLITGSRDEMNKRIRMVGFLQECVKFFKVELLVISKQIKNKII